MNLVQAIIEVNMEGRKVFKAGEHTVESCDKINCCNGSTTVDHSHNVFVKNLPALMQLDFTEVKPATDWSKVKVDAKVKCTQQHGETVNRHFAYFEDGEVHTWMFGVTSWSGNGPSETSPWNPEQVELVED